MSESRDTVLDTCTYFRYLETWHAERAGSFMYAFTTPSLQELRIAPAEHHDCSLASSFSGACAPPSPQWSSGRRHGEAHRGSDTSTVMLVFPNEQILGEEAISGGFGTCQEALGWTFYTQCKSLGPGLCCGFSEVVAPPKFGAP